MFKFNIDKINENGIFRTMQKALFLVVLPYVRYNIFKYLYKFEKIGKNIQFFQGIDFYNTRTSFGNNIVIGEHVLFAGTGKITIGDNTGIGPYSCLNSLKEITIGKDCQIARLCNFYDQNHYFDDSEKPYTKQTSYEKDLLTARPIIIEDNCWLGVGVIVLRGVTIGTGSVIGAGAVVTKSIPPYSVAVGVPAKVIRKIRKSNAK